jgi:hypothetical protein
MTRSKKRLPQLQDRLQWKSSSDEAGIGRCDPWGRMDSKDFRNLYSKELRELAMRCLVREPTLRSEDGI